MDDAALSDAAKLALDSTLVIQAVKLSTWIAESGPRPITPRQVLPRPDIAAAAAMIGAASPENPRTAADVLAAWLDGLLTVSGSETGSPWDDSPAGDILVFLTAALESADGVPPQDVLMRQAVELAERIGESQRESVPAA